MCSLLENQNFGNLSGLTWGNINNEVAFDITVEVRVTWKIGMKYKLLDAMSLPIHLIVSYKIACERGMEDHLYINRK